MPPRVLTRARTLISRVVPRGERFETRVPSAETAIDAAPGDWASRLPPPLDALNPRGSPLFEDERIAWGFERLGGVAGRTVLELGPLEGGHSYMAQRAGAERVTAVEANREAFLKCLVVKDLFELDRVSFLCGEAMAFLESSTEAFDVCVACGILYHMVEPVRMLELISRRAARLILWTHVYDEQAIAGTELAKRMGPAENAEQGGFAHRVHRHRYGLAPHLTGFWGGTRPYSNWLTKDDLLGALRHFGWRDIELGFEERHQHGPALALTAVRDA
jgi:hypothetical protein